MRCSSSLTVEPGKSGLPVAISYWMQPTPLQGAMGRADVSLGLLAPALLALLHHAPRHRGAGPKAAEAPSTARPPHCSLRLGSFWAPGRFELSPFYSVGLVST